MLMRNVFRYAGLEGATALSVRRTFVARLDDSGADEDLVGVVLGMGGRRAVREQFPRIRPTNGPVGAGTGLKRR